MRATEMRIVCVCLVFIFISPTLGQVLTPGSGSDKIYDIANIRKDFLIDQCVAEGSKISNHEIYNFLNCTQSGLAFPFSDKMDPEEMAKSNRLKLENWCYMWPKEKDCERHNLKFIDKCLSSKVHVAVGYDLLTAFFEYACTSKGQAIPILSVFLRRVQKECWYKTNELVTCVDALNVEHFQRNLRKITDCLQAQLLYCETNEPRVLLIEILNQIVKTYSSSGFVYLLKYDDDINSAPSTLNLNSSSNDNINLFKPSSLCYSSKIAYIAFFSLIAVILLVTAATLMVRLELLKTIVDCRKREHLINESTGNSVELVGD